MFTNVRVEPDGAGFVVYRASRKCEWAPETFGAVVRPDSIDPSDSVVTDPTPIRDRRRGEGA